MSKKILQSSSVATLICLCLSLPSFAMHPYASEEKLRTAGHMAQIKNLQTEGKECPTHIHEAAVAKVANNYRNPSAAKHMLDTAKAANPSQSKARAQAETQVRAQLEAEARNQAQARARAEAEAKIQARAKEIAANNAEIERLINQNKKLSGK